MKKYIIICVLAVIAFINASFLTYKSYAPATDTFCDINSRFSCTTVLSSSIAKIGWIIPFPMVAMIVYPILFVLAYLWRKQKNSKYFKTLAVLSAMGIVFNSYFIYLEATVINTFCPLCLICSAIILTIFFLSLSEIRKK